MPRSRLTVSRARLSHHRAELRRRGRRAVHARCAGGGGAFSRGYRLHQAPHGTSTMADVIELAAVRAVVGNACGQGHHARRVDDRASLGAAERDRGDLLDPRVPAIQVGAADDQLDNPAEATPVDLAAMPSASGRSSFALLEQLRLSGGTKRERGSSERSERLASIASNALTFFMSSGCSAGRGVVWAARAYEAEGPLEGRRVCLQVPRGASMWQRQQNLGEQGAVELSDAVSGWGACIMPISRRPEGRAVPHSGARLHGADRGAGHG